MDSEGTCIFVGLQSGEITYLPVEQLHSWAYSLSTKFEQARETRYIGEAVDLDRQALALCPPGHSELPFSLIQLALHLSDRYGQLGAMRDLEDAIVLCREALGFRS